MLPTPFRPAGYWSASLFWRIFLLNGVVFVLGVCVLAFSPATVSWPVMPAELAILGMGLLLMMAVNALLLRLGLAPLERLMSLMGTVDILRPGQRIPERVSGDMAPLTHAFNDMLARLERERAASSTHVLSAQEAERRRIARELHDEIGQGLTVLLLELSRLADQVPDDQRPSLKQAVETARESLADVRRIAQRLRPGVLEDLGLMPALTALVDEFVAFSGVPVRPRLGPRPALTPEAEVVLFRVAQESLTNIARHARAHTVDLALGVCEDGVRLVVRDDGSGFSGVEGAGIRGMRERALLVGADLTVTARRPHGTVVTLTVPQEPADQEGALDAAGPGVAR